MNAVLKHEVRLAQLPLSAIRIDGDTQSRVVLNDAAVSEYSEAIKAGEAMPAVVVFFDGSTNWLADGFHRFHAHRGAEKESIAADVHTGTKRDAILFSVGANNAHGLRRTNEDKRASVCKLLADAEWKTWSDNKIAKACGVSQPFVGSVRASLITVISEKPTERTYTNKHGTPATMRTEKIGKPASKILPRKDAMKVSLPEKAGPAPKADPKAAARVAALEEEIKALKRELRESRENANELGESLQAFVSAEEGTAAAAKEIKRLLGVVRVTEATRDQYMTKCNELVRTVKSLQRKVEKLEGKK